MFITLLLITQVACEWVEISQQYYRKPFHIHKDDFRDVEDLYANQSISEHKWNTDENDNNKYLLTDIEKVDAKKEFLGKVERIPHTEVNHVKIINTPGKPVRPKLKSEITIDMNKNYNRKVDTNTKYSNFDNINRKINDNIEILDITDVTNESLPHENSFKGTSNNKKRINYTDLKNANLETFIKEESTEEHDVYFTKIQPQDLLNEGIFTKDKDIINITKENVKSDAKNTQSNVKQKTEKVLSNEKTNSIEILIKFMKVVSDTISQNTRRSFSSKVQYLEELKNSIMANIEERIDAAWPKDNSRKRRASPSVGSERGHMDFPSSESTLMTISFLTFAVFLVKLVLQVIQTYKNKTMMVAPLVVATAGRAIVNNKQ